MQLPLHGAVGDPEDGGDLPDGAVLEVAQHHHGALLGGQPEHRPRQVKPVEGGIERVRGCGLRHLFRGALPAPERAAALGDRQVDQNRPQVGATIVCGLHGGPVHGRALERALDEVVGTPLLTADGVSEAAQPGGLAQGELTELLVT